MECTQRLDFECSQVERICPEQIGFLGILGTKYPVKRGPNKIGRDPLTCSIVLNKNSISRQHAVINVLNGNKYMLMDLDSANKTKLNNKSLQAYIPVPLTNGDTVQFGEVFGIFRLLEEETDLPCTQAIDIPDTPVSNKHASRVMQATIPESPDVSDKDDSFIVPSQPKSSNQFKSPSNKFIKPSGRTITAPTIGSNKINNVFWSSSNKSNSFNLDDSNFSLNDSGHNGDVHEAKTKAPHHESSDSIFTAETQLPTNVASTSIHSLSIQLPSYNLPAVCKIYNQHEVQLDLCTTKTIENNIHNAETQCVSVENDLFEANTQLPEDHLSSPNSGNNIFEANTQFPFDKSLENNDSDNLFEANTQMPFDKSSSEEDKVIFEANTQMPFKKSSENSKNANIFEVKTKPPFELDETNKVANIYKSNTELSLVKTAENKLNVEKDLPSTNNEDNNKTIESINKSFDICIEMNNKTSDEKPTDLDKSEDVILLNEMVTQDFLDDFQSQPILDSEPENKENVFLNQDNEEDIPLSQSDTITDEDIVVKQDENPEILSQIKPTKRNLRIESGGSSENAESQLSQVKPTKKNICIESDESTDCEDINLLPTQIIPAKCSNEDELTDCEDDSNLLPNKIDDNDDLATLVIPDIVADTLENNAKRTVLSSIDNKPVHTQCFEDMLTQVIPEDSMGTNIEDMPTQVIPEVSVGTNIEDMPTQVIPEINVEANIEDMPTQVIPQDIPHKTYDTETLQFSEEIVNSPFKVPLQTPFRSKRKDAINSSETTIFKPSPSLIKSNTIINVEDNDKYYAETQDILEDLCSQKDTIDIDSKTVNNNNDVDQVAYDNIFPNVDNKATVTKFEPNESTESSDGEDMVNKFVTNLSAEQIGDVIGIDVAKPKKVPSDPSDVEVTPKKIRLFKQTEFPDSQEIKNSVSLSSKTIATESSSESETEKESQEQTPIVFRKKTRAKKCNVKKDLSTKFDVLALPTRIITRTRKPTSKLQESDAATRKGCKNILRPKYLVEHDDQVDTDIISENITKLKRKNDKKNITELEEKSNNGTNKIENLFPTEVELAANRSSNGNQKKDDMIDLTRVDQISSKTSKLDEKCVKSDQSVIKSKKINIKTGSSKDKSESVDDKNKSDRKFIVIDADTLTLKPRQTRKKTDTQGKITNYIIPNVSKEDESKVSSTSKDQSLNSTADTNKSSRTRNKKVNYNDEKKSVTPEQDTIKRKRGRPRKNNGDKSQQKKDEEDNNKDDKSRKKVEIHKEPEEQPMRRSKRQRKVQEQPEKSDFQPKITCTHEQSTVYNISSESGADSPKAVKRSATIDVDVYIPNPKRTRAVVSVSFGATSGTSSSNSSGVHSNRSSLCATPISGVRTHHVLFTAFPCEEVKIKLEKLGAVVVSDVLSCSVVLTQSLRRTFKLLCAVGLGRPIVGPQWVQACVDTNTLVDPWQYLLKDETSETRFKFSLARTLAGPRNYLKGYYVSATPKVMPSAAEMKLIVECSGGVWGERAGAGRWVAVSCVADKPLWAALRKKGAALVTTEFILSGVLRQHPDIDAYLIK